jgi:hypothetical protein
MLLAHGSIFSLVYMKISARESSTMSEGLGSQEWGSTPGGRRSLTSAAGPATSRAKSKRGKTDATTVRRPAIAFDVRVTVKPTIMAMIVGRNRFINIPID